MQIRHLTEQHIRKSSSYALLYTDIKVKTLQEEWTLLYLKNMAVRVRERMYET